MSTPLPYPSAYAPGVPQPPPPPPTGPVSDPTLPSEEPFPEEERARLRARWARPRMDTPRRRRTHVVVALVLILGGLSLAIANGTHPAYQVTQLAPSGSFFSLAMGGNTLYAASANSGSIVLEKSTDRGLTWSMSAVPYSLIASNSSGWTRAAVAVDGSNIMVTATSGQGNGIYPGVPSGGYCATNTSLLLAASNDNGVTWRSQTTQSLGVSVGSLQVGVEGNVVAVAWLGRYSACGMSSAAVDAIASLDGGDHWSAIQNLTPPGGSVSGSQNLEMAESTQGIVLAFEEQSAGGANLLNFWRLDAGGSTSLFHPVYGTLPAPSSWTLQGDSTTSAFLLTPTYLIQLANGGLSGIPFSQLQQDSGSEGALPRVVSIVPSASSGASDSVEVAATLPSGSGVDCWHVDLVSGEISQTCHVSLDSLLLPTGSSYPIVSLLYGSGWWVAVGAASPPEYGGVQTGTAAASPSSVGTSVCLTGCESSQGLVAYYYTESPTLAPSAITGIAALLSLVGLLWFLVARRARRVMHRLDGESPGAPRPEPVSSPPGVATLYRKGLVMWGVVWVPLVLLAYASASGGSDPLFPYLIVGGGILGTFLALPFLWGARKSVQEANGLRTFGSYLVGERWTDRARAFDRSQAAVDFAYASWVGGFLALLALLFAIIFTPYAPVTSGAVTTPQLSVAATILLLIVVAVVVLRALYHGELGAVVGAATAGRRAPARRSREGTARLLRTWTGAALLPWNPFVGLLLGWALQPLTSMSPYVLALVFLPVTLLGMLVLNGGFGKTAWAEAAWE